MTRPYNNYCNFSLYTLDTQVNHGIVIFLFICMFCACVNNLFNRGYITRSSAIPYVSLYVIIVNARPSLVSKHVWKSSMGRPRVLITGNDVSSPGIDLLQTK